MPVGLLRARRRATEIKMRKFPIAAAALLLGTSAYAMIPSTDPAGGPAEETTAITPVYDEAPALQPAAVDNWTLAEPAAYTAETNEPALKAVTASSDDVKAAAMADQAVKADAQLAAHDNAAIEDLLDATNSAPVETAAAESIYGAATGMGGPYEPVDTAAADLTPRPAAQNYPACRPGPGDDNCIQLYEPGVRQQLAAWTQPTGGFAGTSGTQVAMGGPYEPVDAAAEPQDVAMNGDGNINTALGETPEDEDVVEI